MCSNRRTRTVEPRVVNRGAQRNNCAAAYGVRAADLVGVVRCDNVADSKPCGSTPTQSNTSYTPPRAHTTLMRKIRVTRCSAQ